MAVPAEIKARTGDRVLTKWLALLRFISRTNKIITGNGVRISYMPSGGVHVFAEDNFNPWDSPFLVSASATEARVGDGLVNGVTPTINDVRIDGRDGAVPPLKIESLGVDKSYIVIKLIFDAEKVAVDPQNPESIIIEHVAELPASFAEGGSELHDNTAIYPLAALYWQDGKTFRHAFQIVHHNLNHRFVQGSATEGKPSRHLFWAA